MLALEPVLIPYQLCPKGEQNAKGTGCEERPQAQGPTPPLEPPRQPPPRPRVLPSSPASLLLLRPTFLQSLHLEGLKILRPGPHLFLIIWGWKRKHNSTLSLCTLNKNTVTAMTARINTELRGPSLSMWPVLAHPCLIISVLQNWLNALAMPTWNNAESRVFTESGECVQLCMLSWGAWKFCSMFSIRSHCWQGEGQVGKLEMLEPDFLISNPGPAPCLLHQQTR